MEFSIVVFENALQKLINASEKAKDEYIRDSVIQRFEFCIELAWKSAKKYMGTSSTAPKEVVREMAQNRLVDDVNIWLLAIDMRNLSSHTYNEEKAEEVYKFALDFIPTLKLLSERLKNK